MSLSEFVSSVFMLTLVMDPAGNIPLFISTLKNVPSERRTPVIIRELLIALGIMLFFLLFGRSVMAALNINVISLNVAGGIILFLIALGMIFPSSRNFSENPEEEPFIVPLAVPLVSGPSALTVILIFTMKTPYLLWPWLGIILCAWLINVIVLAFSHKLSGFLGKRGMMAVEKLMGMLLVVISVQMFLEGIRDFILK